MSTRMIHQPRDRRSCRQSVSCHLPYEPGLGEDTLTNQFIDAVAYAVGASWIVNILGDRNRAERTST
jgi:hypothetical protein